MAELEEIKKNKEKVIENRVSARTKREILINFSKASEEYRKGNYGAITYARDQVRKIINKAMAVMSESELRAYIQKNPDLLNMVENDVGVKGEIIKPINLKNLSLGTSSNCFLKSSSTISDPTTSEFFIAYG